MAAEEGTLDEARRLLLKSLSMERVIGRPRALGEVLEGLVPTVCCSAGR